MRDKESIKDEIKDFAKSLLRDMDSFNVIVKGDSIDFFVLPKSLYEKEILVKDKKEKKTYKISISVRQIIDMESIAIIYSEFDDITKNKDVLKLFVSDDTTVTDDLKNLYEEIRTRIKKVIERSKELANKNSEEKQQRFLRL